METVPDPSSDPDMQAQAYSEQSSVSPRLVLGSTKWESRGACNTGDGRLAKLFFTTEVTADIENIQRARMYCAACIVRTTCLQVALERREPWGVWGGELFYEGGIIPDPTRGTKQFKK